MACDVNNDDDNKPVWWCLVVSSLTALYRVHIQSFHLTTGIPAADTKELLGDEMESNGALKFTGGKVEKLFYI